tara:strand:- start:1060 stop:1167 length:108 start_codon:yes stop_codon:yes gene_type:complete
MQGEVQQKYSVFKQFKKTFALTAQKNRFDEMTFED